MDRSSRHHPHRASPVARALGAGTGTDRECATTFARTMVPKEWKARVVLQDLWHDSGAAGIVQYGLLLDSFPYRFSASEDFDGMRRIVYTVGDELHRRLSRIAGASVQSDGARLTDRSPHMWRWSFSYRCGGTAGNVMIWIVPRGRSKALMSVDIVEFRAALGRP